MTTSHGTGLSQSLRASTTPQRTMPQFEVFANPVARARELFRSNVLKSQIVISSWARSAPSARSSAPACSVFRVQGPSFGAGAKLGERL
jgi:hypothetical protein